MAGLGNLSFGVCSSNHVSFSSGSLPGATSSNVVVGPATASRLTILTQPASTATAGVAFAPQPVVRIEDQIGTASCRERAQFTASGLAACNKCQAATKMH